MRTLQTYETTVKNGFPVVYHFNLYPAEKDVGINSYYVEDGHFTTLTGKKCDWLNIPQSDIDRIEEEILDNWSQ